MNWSLRIFSIKGIEIKVHLTFILILIWAGYRWGIALQAGSTGVFYGIVVTLLLFGCVILHELAHSFVAIHYGAKVKNIILLPIGGVAQMEQIPKKPEQELQMALAGPFSNIIIVAILIAVCWVSGNCAIVSFDEISSLFASMSLNGLLTYLVIANLMLAIFNLFPAFPMDGGRVLRAILAFKLDYAKATVWAAKIGQGLSWLLGLYGFASGNWTLVLIAVFIYNGAGHEGKLAEVKRTFNQIRVYQVMSTKVMVLTPQTPLAQAAEAALQSLQAGFPVVEGDQVVGLLSEADLIIALQKFSNTSLVGEVMRGDFPSSAPKELLFKAHERMSKAKVSAMPVIFDGKLIGMLTARDISEAYRLLVVNPHFFKGQNNK